MPATISDLPDAVLAEVFMAAMRAGRVAERRQWVCVCRRWRQVALAEPALWRHFVLRPPNRTLTNWQEEWLAAAHSCLSSYGQHVRTTDFRCGAVAHRRDGAQVVELLSLLSPQLVSLQMNTVEPGIPPPNPAPTSIVDATLRSFPHLTHLSLSCVALLPPAAAPLRALTALRSLSLSCPLGLAPAVAAAAVSLTSLTSLSLLSNGRTNLHTVGMLTSLTRLTQLHTLTIKLQLYMTDMGEVVVEPLVLPTARDLPALHILEVSTPAGIQMGDARLSSCTYTRTPTGEDMLDLRLDDDHDQQASLATLLASTLPPSAPSRSQLRRLGLGSSTLGSMRWHDCALQLGQLTSLTLHDCYPEAGLPALLAEILPLLPALRALTLERCSKVDDCEVPAAITELQGLRELSLRNIGLESLAPGPYLDDLTLLDLRDNDLKWLPLAVRDATNLRTLKLNGCPLHLRWGDASTVLRHMHLLRVLQLDDLYRQPPEVLQELKRKQPMLKVQCDNVGYRPQYYFSF